MLVRDLLPPDAVRVDVPCTDKRSVLREMAAQAAHRASVSEREVLESLSQREKLGTTGLGGGIALPHARIKGLEAPVACFAKLEHPVPFDAPDLAPVDLVFLFLAPEEPPSDLLRSLAQISALMRRPHVVERLRDAQDSETIVRVLENAQRS